MTDYKTMVNAKYSQLERQRKETRWSSGEYGMLLIAGLTVTAESTADAFGRVAEKISELENMIEALNNRISELETKPAEKWSLR